MLGVSAIAAALGLNQRAQAMAALVCATLPNAILQASGAKNDFLLAFCLVCAVYFALRRDPLLLSLSIALAIFTKATAWLFLPPLVLYIAFVFPRRILLWMAAAILLINGPQYRAQHPTQRQPARLRFRARRWILPLAQRISGPRIARLQRASPHLRTNRRAQCPLESGHLRCRPERPPRARARPQRSRDHLAR